MNTLFFSCVLAIVTSCFGSASESGVAFFRYSENTEREFLVGGIPDNDKEILLVVEAAPHLRWTKVIEGVQEKCKALIISKTVIVAGDKVGVYKTPIKFPVDGYYAAYSNDHQEIREKRNHEHILKKYNNVQYRLNPVQVGQSSSTVGSDDFLKWVEKTKARREKDEATVEVAVLFPQENATTGEMATVLSELGKLSMSVVLLESEPARGTGP